MEADNVVGQPRIPMGKYKGQLISALATQFLLWFLTQENLRSKYSEAAQSIVEELRGRFGAPGRVERELAPSDGSDLV